MPKVVSYLNCACAILEGGGRTRCPSCEADIEVHYFQGISDVLLIRCLEHRDIPAYNSSEASGGECAACAVEALRREFQQRFKEQSDLLFDTINAIKREIDSRDWILQGRGPYEWNDDQYRLEAGLAFTAVLEIRDKAVRDGKALWDEVASMSREEHHG